MFHTFIWHLYFACMLILHQVIGNKPHLFTLKIGIFTGQSTPKLQAPWGNASHHFRQKWLSYLGFSGPKAWEKLLPPMKFRHFLILNRSTVRIVQIYKYSFKKNFKVIRNAVIQWSLIGNWLDLFKIRKCLNFMGGSNFSHAFGPEKPKCDNHFGLKWWEALPHGASS